MNQTRVCSLRFQEVGKGTSTVVDGIVTATVNEHLLCDACSSPS